jgi:hypothetical protein
MATNELPRLLTIYGWGSVIDEWEESYLMMFNDEVFFAVNFSEIMMPVIVPFDESTRPF